MPQMHLPRKVNIAFRFASGVPASEKQRIPNFGNCHGTLHTRTQRDRYARRQRVFCTQFFLGIGLLGSSCWVWRSNSVSTAREYVPRGLIKALRCPMLWWRESAHCAYTFFYFTFGSYLCDSLVIAIGSKYSLFLYHRVITQNYPR